MNKMSLTDIGYIVNQKREYNALGIFPYNILMKCFNFAYEMSFGEVGKHRERRSGGDKNRKNGEIFINVFQGKLAEHGMWNEFEKRNIKISSPDLSEYGLGEWDNFDLDVMGYKVAVKSTKYYGNLLLLEQKNWNSFGEYVPNISKGTSHNDFFLLIRIGPDGEKLMRENKFLYKNNINITELKEIIINEKNIWSYDIAGFITHKELCEIIENENIIKKDSMLNIYTKMDADNYYVQAGDMRNIEELFKLINENTLVYN
ncbi:hypothetical protein [Clostridium sp.]|uniref:hypothetical protein n=1 Tax=Clostridium sp. TaxID=1506 RepID=UPI00284BA0C3|nr:hypothetical protein [Clostridium sp.]MDR3597720.1 hypothetical protein [Clostridium sp.]